MSIEPLSPRARAAASSDLLRPSAPRASEIGRALRSVYSPPQGSSGFDELLHRIDAAERCFH
jgi:hypothetical protein